MKILTEPTTYWAFVISLLSLLQLLLLLLFEIATFSGVFYFNELRHFIFCPEYLREKGVSILTDPQTSSSYMINRTELHSAMPEIGTENSEEQD